MVGPDSLKLNDALENWVNSNCSNEEMTPPDIEEFKDYILNTTEELTIHPERFKKPYYCTYSITSTKLFPVLFCSL